MFGKNWKTMVCGLVAAFFSYVLFDPDTFHGMPWLVTLAKFAMVGGLAGLGLTAKDYNVTGGSKTQ